jgi:hypothetical protein
MRGRIFLLFCDERSVEHMRMKIWSMFFGKETLKTIAGPIFVLGALYFFTDRPSDANWDINPVLIFLSSPFQLLKESQAALLYCLFAVSFCWFFYRLRKIVYAYLYLAILVSICNLLTHSIQF